MDQAPSNTDPCGARSDLERGRESHARRSWAAAHEALCQADRTSPLGAEDLERLALAAYLIGRDDEYLSLLQRAYHAHLATGSSASAARTAFWLGLRLLFRGEAGQSSGWLRRAQRLVDGQSSECATRGYLLLAVTQLRIEAGDLAAANESALDAVRIGERFADPDLLATARHLLGRIQLQQGQVPAGLSLLDEAMLAAAGGELSPLVTGLIYCSVIEGCQEVYALGRAREWTRALADWCAQQPEMVAFVGLCSVHRAELLQLHGTWESALEETERALARCLHVNRRATGAAYYQQAELRRLRGELEAAEEGYQRASQWGFEPQPGVALLRLAQARPEAAARSLRSALAGTIDRSRRARLLPAEVEILLASGKLEDAAAAARDLAEIAAHFESELLRAAAAQARGAVQLARGDAGEALGSLRRAAALWQELEVPYCAARVSTLIARCCRALNDEEGERLELDAARTIFERIGARADLVLLGSARAPAVPANSLTARERQVLRQLAMGHTNKAIAADLQLSEKTVERHVSNIFIKLDVSSRSAATAYAYQHRLL